MFIRWCHVTDGRMRGHGFHIRDFYFIKSAERAFMTYSFCVCVCVCVWEREREREREWEAQRELSGLDESNWLPGYFAMSCMLRHIKYRSSERVRTDYILSKSKNSHTCPKICCTKTSLVSGTENISNRLKRLGAYLHDRLIKTG